jgi:hypothetical protein
VIFVSEWPKGEFVSILASFYVWTKSLMCKDAVKRDSTCQSIFRRLCTSKKIEDFVFPVSRPDNVSSRPDDVSFPSGPCIVSRSFCSNLHPSGRPSVIDQLQILSKFIIWEDRLQLSGRCGFPSRRDHK